MFTSITDPVPLKLGPVEFPLLPGKRILCLVDLTASCVHLRLVENIKLDQVGSTIVWMDFFSLPRVVSIPWSLPRVDGDNPASSSCDLRGLFLPSPYYRPCASNSHYPSPIYPPNEQAAPCIIKGLEEPSSIYTSGHRESLEELDNGCSGVG